MKLTWLPGRPAAGAGAWASSGAWLRAGGGRQGRFFFGALHSPALPACDNRETGQRRRPARALLTLLAPTMPPGRPHTALAWGVCSGWYPRTSVAGGAVWEAGRLRGFSAARPGGRVTPSIRPSTCKPIGPGRRCPSHRGPGGWAEGPAALPRIPWGFQHLCSHRRVLGWASS